MISSAHRPRILVVDDDPGILRAVSRILGQQYEVATAPGALSALDMAILFRPDVGILDIRMPEMNGFELMKRMHALVPDVDVILMTGNSEEPDATLVQAIDAGAFYFIQKPFERRVLLALATRCFELRRLREEKQQYTRRLEKDLEEAAQFQLSLLPAAQMDLVGLSICARRVACQALAGDFYDYVEAGKDAAAILIADVVGHGTSAAMMTGIVKAAFHAARVDGFRPLGVINRVKEGIRSFDADRFITLCSVHIDLANRRLTYASAGHPPLVLRRQGADSQLLASTGTLISSALIDLECEEVTVSLEDRDFLLFYTDGITEAMGPSGMFGQSRITSLLEQSAGRGPQLLEEILAAVNEHSAGRDVADDMTLLAAEFISTR